MKERRSWLVRTEPDEYSIDDLRRDRQVAWTGVRNYQARNNLSAMQRGDTVLIYHSNAAPSAIVGLGTVTQTARPDETQFDRKSDFFDPKATREKPRWVAPQIGFTAKLKQPLTLDQLRADRRLAEMLVLKKGMRLSVQPVTPDELVAVLELAGYGTRGRKPGSA